MADFDKDSLMNILNSLISNNKGSDTNASSFENVQNVQNVQNMQDIQENGNTDFSSFSADPELLNTAEIMTKMTGLIDRMNRCKNNREFVLLSALRPYMRTARRGRIDACLKVLQVINVFNDMKKES